MRTEGCLATARSESERAQPVSVGTDCRIAVVIATTGRPTAAGSAVRMLARQTRAPDQVLIVAVTESDVVGIREGYPAAQIMFSERGLCAQRNRGLDRLADSADLVVFFDDDFLPRDDYLANAKVLFTSHPRIAGATGRIIADGANGPGIAFEDGRRLLEQDTGGAGETLRPRTALYGCNMVIRTRAAWGLRFDEELPLYGWQEDIDFTVRLGARGDLVRSNDLAGVHLGEKSGRVSGKRFGYSQIANPLYLLQKETTPRWLAFQLIRRNLASNLLRSVWPEPWIDRRGRLAGNIRALWDLWRRRLHPRRILEMR